MNQSAPESSANRPALTWRQAIAYFVGAIASFHIAFTFPGCAVLIIGFLFCLLQLSRLRTSRQVFYVGLSVGLLAYAPQLTFFWNIFHAAAIPLWLVLSFWMALFLLLTRMVRTRFPRYALLVMPFLWLGLEYFRSELYYLRFSWLSVGYVFSSVANAKAWPALGVYGMGFVCMVAAVLLSGRPKGMKAAGAALTVILALSNVWVKQTTFGPSQSIRVSGVQLEFREEDVLTALDRVRTHFPDTDVYVLSEYTFSGPPPARVMQWCAKYRKYLVAGGKDDLSKTEFYNTAFVVGRFGEIAFRQVKSVPIQFFKDGLPAPTQQLWKSPWGDIGICICYDLSYRKVVDQLIKQGAQALIVPTMDVVDWGKHQHELHGRIAPMRAVEYGVPIFRLCSSGISQAVAATGEVIASASFPGEGEMISARLNLAAPGHLPVDYWLAPFAAVVTGLSILSLAVLRFVKRPQTPRT